MSFLRHREICPSDLWADEGAGFFTSAPTPRLDEFPAGYSSAGCSPAEPASASPAALSLRWLFHFAYRFAANGILSLVPLSQPKGAVQSN